MIVNLWLIFNCVLAVFRCSSLKCAAMLHSCHTHSITHLAVCLFVFNADWKYHKGEFVCSSRNWNTENESLAHSRDWIWTTRTAQSLYQLKLCRHKISIYGNLSLLASGFCRRFSFSIASTYAIAHSDEHRVFGVFSPLCFWLETHICSATFLILFLSSPSNWILIYIQMRRIN